MSGLLAARSRPCDIIPEPVFGGSEGRTPRPGGNAPEPMDPSRATWPREGGGAVWRLFSSPCHPLGGGCLGNGNVPAEDELVREFEWVDMGDSTVGEK